jgi:DNA adenine methylase
MDFYSPLRYPGGKGKVSGYFKQIIKDNLLYDGIYVEPYAGGASVALSLLLNEYVSKIIVNDIDKSIYGFWHSALNKTDELCKLIRDTPLNIKHWDTQREIQKTKQGHSLLKVGFSTFYLNRTNRSGILNAGVIGGRDQTGKWKMDARYNKTDLIKRIERIALYKNKIELYNSDAVILIKSLRKTLPAKSLFYCDPPYYVKGEALYLNFYDHDDHEAIASEISNVKRQRWIVTYDNVRPIRSLYADYRKKKYSLNYSAASPSKGEEVMIFSDNLAITSSPMRA